MEKIQLQDLKSKQAPAGTGMPTMIIFKYAKPESGAQKITLQDLTAKQIPAGTGSAVMWPFRQRDPREAISQHSAPMAIIK